MAHRLPIFQTAATTDSLYALTAPLVQTESGRRLRAIRFATNVNIVDPANWKLVTAPGLQTESIAVNLGRLSATVNGQGIYERQQGRWVLMQSLTNPIIRQFTGPSSLILATNQAVTLTGTGTFHRLITDRSTRGCCRWEHALGRGYAEWFVDDQFRHFPAYCP